MFPPLLILTLVLATEAAPEGKALLTAPAATLFPLLSHSSSSYSPNEPNTLQAGFVRQSFPPAPPR